MCNTAYSSLDQSDWKIPTVPTWHAFEKLGLTKKQHTSCFQHSNDLVTACHTPAEATREMCNAFLTHTPLVQRGSLSQECKNTWKACSIQQLSNQDVRRALECLELLEGGCQLSVRTKARARSQGLCQGESPWAAEQPDLEAVGTEGSSGQPGRSQPQHRKLNRLTIVFCFAQVSELSITTTRSNAKNSINPESNTVMAAPPLSPSLPAALTASVSNAASMVSGHVMGDASLDTHRENPVPSQHQPPQWEK
eukprot:741641-Amphidinium_carterae.1